MTRDLLLAVRWLRKNPLFAVTVIAILAIGIGANTAVFSVVDAVLLRPLPYLAAQRLVKVEENVNRSNGVVSTDDYLALRNRNDIFEQIAAYRKDVLTVTGIGRPDQFMAVRASSELFSLLGVHAQIGRTFGDADDQQSSPDLVVLSDRLWRRVFQANTDVIGRRMTLSGSVFIIIGVMPKEFEFPDANVGLWTSFKPLGSNYSVQILARLREGISLAQAQSAVTILAHQLEQQSGQRKAALEIVVSPWRQTAEREYELTLIFVLVAVGLVLLIACGGVGSLLLSRAIQRQKEIAIRLSLGASSWRIARQLLAETLVLAISSTVIGVALGHYILQFLSKAMLSLPIALPRVQTMSLNGRVLSFSIGLCLLSSCLLTLMPVLLTRRTDVQTALHSGVALKQLRRPSRMFSILIASEAACVFLSLVGAGLMIRSLIRLQQEDHGLHPDHVLTMQIPIGTLTQPKPVGRYETKPEQMSYYDTLLRRLHGIPGVKSVAFVNNLPLSGSNTTTPLQALTGDSKLVSTRTISPEYFAVMGIALLAGREFSEADQAGSPVVCIINEYLARQLFPDLDPVGRMLPGLPVKIIGVVKNSPQLSYEEPAKGELYYPFRQFLFGTFLSTIVVRTQGNPLSIANRLSKEVWTIDPDQPIVKVKTMNDVISDSIWRPRFSAWILSILAVLALSLTAAGVYGIVAYMVVLRAKETAIRVALGATSTRILSLIIRDALLPLSIGLAVSFVLALLLSRLLTSLLYEISRTDPVTYLGATLLLIAIGVIASAWPGWKATKRNPLEALRME
jgi:putative ABC transport system permease protein